MNQGLTDLQNNVTALAAEVANVKTFVANLNTQITQLQATIAAGGDNDAAVETQAQAIASQITSLNGIVNPIPAPPAAPVSPAAPAA